MPGPSGPPEQHAKLRSDKTRLQAGFVAIDPLTGHVKAWVGSRDFKTDQFDHVIQARRQPGSIFKPFVYGAAMEQGMSPDKRFIDRAVEIRLPDGTMWRPTDLSEATGEPMTAREGLVLSKNTITVQVMQEVGPKKTADLARRMGVNQSKLDEVPSLALGTSPVTPFEMVSAYSTLAARGEYRTPIFITRITDNPATDTFPQWSPDGTEIAVYDEFAQGLELPVESHGLPHEKLASAAAHGEGHLHAQGIGVQMQQPPVSDGQERAVHAPGDSPDVLQRLKVRRRFGRHRLRRRQNRQLLKNRKSTWQRA